MTFARRKRRVLAAVASFGALLVVAACGGGGDEEPGGAASAPADEFTQFGEVEVWRGKDVSGNFPKLVEKFNAQHTQGKVIFHELPDEADQQRQQMVQNTQIKNPKMGILSVDVVWTSEFAAKDYIVEIPGFDTNGHLKAAVDAGTYFGKLYAAPSTTDGGILYYRKDLLDKYSLQPPTTFDEMKAACDKITQGENNDKLGCFAGQYNKYEGLTVNFDEAVHSAGGEIVNAEGKPNVNTPEAAKGLQTLADWFKDGYIPKAAITWTEEEGRNAFQSGELIFHRNWGYVYNLANKDDGSSKVNGKFDVAPLPGVAGPGVSSLGGHNYAIAKNAAAKGTALEFLKFMSAPEQQKSNTLATSESPTLEALYTDPEVLKKFSFMPTQLKSIQSAVPRPKAVEYGDVTLAIQDAAYGALQAGAQGQTADATAALQALQEKLQTLIK